MSRHADTPETRTESAGKVVPSSPGRTEVNRRHGLAFLRVSISRADATGLLLFGLARAYA